MKFFILTLFLFISAHNLWGQNKGYYNKIAVATQGNQWEKALALTDSLYAYGEEINNVAYMVNSITLKGEVYLRKNELEAAHQCFSTSLYLGEHLKSPDPKTERIYFNLFALFMHQDNQDSALHYADQIIAMPCNNVTFIQKIKVTSFYKNRGESNKCIAIINDLIDCAADLKSERFRMIAFTKSANMHQSIESYAIAITQADSALQISERIGDTTHICSNYANLTSINSLLGNHEKALEWAKKNVALADLIKAKRVAYKEKLASIVYYVNIGAIYERAGVTYYEVHKNDSSYLFFQKALDDFYSVGDRYAVVEILSNLSELMIRRMHNYDDALDTLRKAERFISSSNQTEQYFAVFNKMGEAFMGLGQLDSAAHYFEKSEKFASILANNRRHLILYQNYIKLYSKKQNFKKAFEAQKLFIQYQDSLYEEGKKEALVKFETRYKTQEIAQENLALEKDNLLQAQELSFNTKLNTRNNYIILALIVLILLLIGIGLLIYRQNKLNTQFNIVRLEQKALKAQINPHFFFNVLNSLQGTILSEKPMVAYKYHSKFTKLMRSVLMQSDVDGIPLKEEIDSLKLYIELEQLRTGNAFDFTIVNNAQNNDEQLVPSMLLQPFVENAIWHGVMNKEEDEEKTITINLNTQGENILCEISDTGVGREKAELIKQQKSNKHKSMGMEVTKNRLELFRLRYNTLLKLKIQDLKDATGVLGTKVTVEIPILKS